MKYLLSLLIFLMPNYGISKPHVTFIVDQFPKATKSVIENQIIGLIEHNFDISIISEQESTVALSNFLQNHISTIHYGSFDTYDFSTTDAIVCQYGSLGKKLIESNNHTCAAIPCVTFFRGADITAYSQTKDNAYVKLFMHNELVMPVCNYFAYIAETLGCDPQKICVQPSGININQFSFRVKKPKNNKPITIISVCRLIEKKGCMYALQAIAQLIRKGYNIRYTLIGNGKQLKKLQQLATQLHISKYVTFLGHQPHDTIAEKLNRSHIFLLPSVTCSNGSQEGIANALKEAMAIGLPVITTYHGGNRELIQHAHNGLLVPERHPHAITQAVIYLLKTDNTWDNIIYNARKTVEKTYDMQSLNTKLAHTLKNLIDKKFLDQED